MAETTKTTDDTSIVEGALVTGNVAGLDSAGAAQNASTSDDTAAQNASASENSDAPKEPSAARSVHRIEISDVADGTNIPEVAGTTEDPGSPDQTPATEDPGGPNTEDPEITPATEDPGGPNIDEPSKPSRTPATEDPGGPDKPPATEDPGGPNKADGAAGSATSPDGTTTLGSADEGMATTAEPGQNRTEAWAKLVADPGHAPELLALAAVQSIGPRAQEWVARNHAAYPTADEAALARLATRQFTRAGSLGSVFGAVAGSYAPVVLLGTAAIAHAELILHLAAAYGLDPADPDRAVDLLVLTRVHPDRGDAEAALAAARRPPYDDGGLSGAAWRLGRMIAAQAGEWGLIRLANRFLPGVSLLATFLTSRAAAESTAARANAYYSEISRGGPRPAETEGPR